MQDDNHPLTAFRKANNLTLEAFGGLLIPTANKSTILRWESGEVLIPIERFGDIERVTGIPRTVLRPDIFGPAPSKSEAAA